MTVAYLTEDVDEESTLKLTVAFTDEDDNAVVPSSATWTLSDHSENIIGELEDVEITPLAASVTLVLTGPDLAIGSYGLLRQVVVKYRYTSDAGTGLYGTKGVNFRLRDYVKVP